MIQELSRHGYRVGPGTLYPILHEMERKGWLRSSTESTDGRKRRVYRATPSGRKALSAAKNKVRELFGELFEERHTRRRTKGVTREG
jgi:DNA-binding PadR family transcriptional regulator